MCTFVCAASIYRFELKSIAFKCKIAIGILFDFCLLFSSFLIASYFVLFFVLDLNHQPRKKSFSLSCCCFLGILILTSAFAAVDDAFWFKINERELKLARRAFFSVSCHHHATGAASLHCFALLCSLSRVFFDVYPNLLQFSRLDCTNKFASLLSPLPTNNQNFSIKCKKKKQIRRE